MGSSEKVVSGGFAAGRSNFSQTCSLLSQYLKEKGSFGDLSLGLMTPKSAEPKGTMDLLPMIEKSGQNTGNGNFTQQNVVLPQLVAGREEFFNRSNISGAKPEVENGQMTIFYAGQVIVFDDFPADKAKEIMTLASKSSATQQNHRSTAFPPPLQSPAESATNTPSIVPSTFPQPALASDLPIARKHSLARFLEKRKDRITANAPYQTNKPAKTEEWLGLAPQRLPQIQRH